MKSFPSSKQFNNLPSYCEAGTPAADLFSQQKKSSYTNNRWRRTITLLLSSEKTSPSISALVGESESPSVSVSAALRASSARHNPTAATYPRRLSGGRLSDRCWGESSFPLRRRQKREKSKTKKTRPPPMGHTHSTSSTAPLPLGPSLPYSQWD